MLKLIIIAIIFLLGLYYVTCPEKVTEGFRSDLSVPYRCPNLLIQKGSHYFLYNTKLAPTCQDKNAFFLMCSILS